MNEQGHIFISYARQDGRDYAARLDADLQKAGFSTWWDTRNIDPNQDFSAEIETGIQKASHVAVCVTPSIDANPSSFVRREVIYAESKGKPVIPLVFPDADLPVLVNHLTWIPFSVGKKPGQKLAYEDGLGQLVGRLKEIPKAVPPRITDDPYREYLTALYDQIVRYLNQTVFSLITLRGEATPDAVERKQVLPMAFWSMAGVEDSPHPPSPSPSGRGGEKPGAGKYPSVQFNNFHEAFEQYDGRVLLLGEPGAGKTTTLFAFARDKVAARLEDPTLPLPILAPIATWDAENQTPLAEWLAEQVPILKKDGIEKLIDNGKSLLLLDGLDELGNERENLDTKERFDPRLRFLQSIPVSNRTIVTCRVKDYGEIGEKADLKGAVTLQALNDEQMQVYLRDLPDLWEALKTDNDLRDVARTPLLLSLFTFAFQELPEEAKALRDLKRGDLRDKIFEIYVRRRYERETRKPNSKILFTLEEIYGKLGYIAMHNAGDWMVTRNLINIKDFSKIISEENLDIFIQLVTDLNLLVQNNETEFRFIHLALRDYFVYEWAIHCLRTNNNPSERKCAANALGEIADERGIGRLIVTLMMDDFGSVRTSAATALGKIGNEAAIHPLITSLYSPYVTVRSASVYALEHIGTPEAFSAIERVRGKRLFRDDDVDW